MTMQREAAKPTRRGLLLAGAALTIPRALQAGQVPPLNIGVLEFGTVGWEIETIRRLGLDSAAGVQVIPTRLASNDAARIAFLGDGVDAIVTDLLWAARMRAEGRNLAFLPFSATEGALMVPPASAIAGVADLAGKAVGVAGGALDKNWLLLQAHARKAADLDLARVARPAFGAPPLLSQKLEDGELDAALLYWNFCARLEAKGYKRIIGADEITRSFGIAGPIAFIGYAFAERVVTGRPDAIRAFAAASRQAKQVLASQDAAWTALRPLMQADDEATYQTLKRRFVEGIPGRAIGDERADAAQLYALLAELGGEKLVGAAKTLPDGLYWTGT
jgi:NitT/TauT family transport system substrate-binding protein